MIAENVALRAEVERLRHELADAEEAIPRRDADVTMHAGRWQKAEAEVERLRADAWLRDTAPSKEAELGGEG